MVPWIPYAFVRLLLFSASGILLGIYFPDEIAASVILSLLITFVIFYFLIVIFRQDHNGSLNPGFIGLPILMLLGYLVVMIRTESNQDDHLSNVEDSISYYTVTVTSYPEEKEKSWKEIGEVTGVKTTNGWKSSSGKVLIYLSKKENRVPFKYGDVLLIKGSPQKVSPPSNPYEFDYKRFLSFKNIHHQDFISSPDFIFIKNDPPNPILSLAYNARAKSMDIINRYVTGQREQAIASALILGITDSLDDSLLNAYAASGAIHVLAVSGLHVGVLYAIIMFFLQPLKKTVSGKWIIAIVSIVCLWSYALLTGLSPSVMRAVTMFTFVALAQPLSKRTNIYNTLSLSAFCLLLYDPYLIMSVGFQLSYLAVLGIVYLYPRLFVMWTPSSWIAAQVWKITCVSLSAQATFSLGLLYFHQFPVYFLFTNLFVIPLSFTVLVSGLLMICISFIPVVANAIGVLLSYAIKLLNGVVLLTEGLPGSLIEGVYLTTFQCYLLFGLVITFIMLFRLRKFALIYASFVLTCLFSVIDWNHWRSIQKPQMIVYNVRGHTAVDIIDKGSIYNFSDSVLIERPELADFQTKGNRIATSVNEIVNGDEYALTCNFSGGRLIQWDDVVMLQITERQFRQMEKLSVDYLVISNNALQNLEKVAGMIDARCMIIDSSNSIYVADNLMKEAACLNYPVHSVLHKGAFVTEL